MNKRLLKVAKYLLENGFENEAAKIKKLAGITESEEEERKKYSPESDWLTRNRFFKNDELDNEYAMKEECKEMGLKGVYNSNNGIPAVLSARFGYWVYRPPDRMSFEDMAAYEHLMNNIDRQGYEEDGNLPVRSKAAQTGVMADLIHLYNERTGEEEEKRKGQWKQLGLDRVI